MAFGDGWLGLQGWWTDVFGGSNRAKLTESDARVLTLEAGLGPRDLSPDSAMRIATVWACVRLLAETVGTLPLGVYRKDAAGRRQIASDHGLYALVHDTPNADQTSAEFIESIVACLALWGNFFAEKDRIGDRLVGLTVLSPSRMSVRRDVNGVRLYRYTDPVGHVREIAEDDLFHVRGFGIGGDLGLAPIGYARRTLTVAMATDEAASHAVRGGTRPSGFLIAPAGVKMTPEQRAQLREVVLDPITGPSGHGRAAVLEGGFDWKDANGLPPEDLQLLQTRAFHIEEICRWFRVPPFMVGHTEKSTSWGTGLEQQMLGFLTFALRPYLVRIEQAVRQQLCTPADRAAGIYAEFNLEGLMRADSTGRANLYASAAQNGWMTRNEIRAYENLPPVDGGDLATAQTNLAPLDKLGDITTAIGGAALKGLRGPFEPHSPEP